METQNEAIAPEAKSQAAAVLGRIRTEKKAAAARRNGFKPGNAHGVGPAPMLLSEIECCIKVGKAAGAPCPGGDALTGHHWSCPRGQAIQRRQKSGRDVQTGVKL
jgi:hypothetical protein